VQIRTKELQKAWIWVPGYPWPPGLETMSPDLATEDTPEGRPASVQNQSYGFVVTRGDQIAGDKTRDERNNR
jgi:hypothetical protein